MKQKILLGLMVAGALSVPVGAWAEAATADEVVAKVQAAAADVAAGGDAALAAYDDAKGKWAWKDDGYVFVMDCAGGTMAAHPNAKVKGMKLAELKGKAGEELGAALCAAAAKGPKGGWVEYMWTKAGADGNHRKVSYVMPAGKYAVGAGVYDDTPVSALEAKTQ